MWTCPKCKESIEDQFDSCWKCAGQAQQAPALPERKKPLERLEFIFLMLLVIPPAIGFLQRNAGGDRLRAAIFDFLVMAVGLSGLIAIWIYRRSKKGQGGKTPG